MGSSGVISETRRRGEKMKKLKQADRFISVVCEMPESGYFRMMKLHRATFLNPDAFEPGNIQTLEEFIGVMALFGAECVESAAANCSSCQSKKAYVICSHDRNAYLPL